ncbi:VPS10 domain-containing protein [Flammeovirga pacifica]|uniref:BIG2 domain-containing protein n=1 Tax=Flammeovirga pacifica TaxID=915059 RepID=A0A1S1YSY8_FLAPC|nr:T9SS type A sorting domain-containing protein [Flammeovirga pacifica]OHX64116.1 hypothetical protein NH26_21150 [Flammeovirga pacifica]
MLCHYQTVWAEENEKIFFSGFEKELDTEWSSVTYTGLPLFERSSDDVFKGLQSCHFRFNDANQKVNFTTSKNIKWEAGKVYKISFYYKNIKSINNRKSNIKFFGGDGSKIGQINFDPLDNSEWTQVKFSFTPTKNDDNGYILFSYHPNSNGKGELFVDNFEVKKLANDFFQELKTKTIKSNPDIKWVQFGPGMSGNNKVAFWHPTDKNTLYIGPNMGNVYRTTDKGKSYETLLNEDAKGFDSGERGPREFYSIDFSRQNANFGFATDKRNLGIYKSLDKGKSWKLIKNSQFNKRFISCITVDPKNDEIWYAGGGRMRDYARVLFSKEQPHGTYLSSASQGKIWKSTDKGISWKLMNNGIHAKTEVETLLVDPNNSNIVYANTNRGFYKSIDAGKTWIKKTEGFDHDVMRAMSYHLNPSTNKITLFVINNVIWKRDGQTVTDAGGGIFKSTDKGESWQKINGDLALDLSFFNSNRNIKKSYYTTVAFYFGMSYSEAVATFPKLPTKITQRFNTIEVDPTDVNNIYLNNEYSNSSKNNFKPGQIWRTKNGGKHWYITLRNGKNWEEGSPDADYWNSRNNPIGNNIQLNYLKHWMKRDDYERKGSNFARFNADGTVLHANMAKVSLMSYDKGDTWVDIDDIEVTPKSDNFVGAGNSNVPGHGFYQHPKYPGQVFCMAGENSLWITNEEGNHIKKGAQAARYKSLTDAEQSISSYAIDPNDTNKHYALFFRQHNKGECLRSLDGGNTWEAIGVAIPKWELPKTGGDQSVHQMHLTIDPVQTKNLYFCVPRRSKNIELVGNTITGFGVHRSTDGGVNWKEINNGLPKDPDVCKIALDPQNSNTIYAAVQDKDGGLFVSLNKGNSWTEVTSTQHISKSEGINDIHFSGDGKVYITSGTKNGGADNGGLWVSEDNLVTWNKIFDYPWTYRVETAVYDPNIILLSTLPNTTINTFNPGVYLSKNGGESWEKINLGNGQSDRVNDIAINNFYPGKYYASTYGSGWYMALDPKATIKAETIYFDENNIKIKKGTSSQLRPIIFPENAHHQGIEYFSEDKTIVSVSSSGKIKGQKKGKTSIYASLKNSDVTTSIDVEVFNSSSPNSLSVSEEWILYPNPTSGKIFLKGSLAVDTIESVSIYDLNGQVHNCKLQKENNKFVIDTSSLKNGIYTLVLNTKNTIKHFKFLKK